MSHRISSLTLAAALIGGFALSASAHAGTVEGASAADLALANSVQQALAQVPALQSGGTDLIVKAQDGRVHLSGFIPYAVDDLPARQVAASVAGVKAISSNLRSWSSETSVPRNYRPQDHSAL